MNEERYGSAEESNPLRRINLYTMAGAEEEGLRERLEYALAPGTPLPRREIEKVMIRGSQGDWIPF